jgi:hypothetical protein
MTAELAVPVRAIRLALPEVAERLSHGAPTWFISNKKSFVTLWAEIAELCQDAYRAIAPARLAAFLDSQGG